jgi:hypothetical protein
MESRAPSIRWGIVISAVMGGDVGMMAFNLPVTELAVNQGRRTRMCVEGVVTLAFTPKITGSANSGTMSGFHGGWERGR